MEKKFLIIKLGAKGDVVRTLSILPAIKKKYPESEIHWVTKPNITQIFEGNPYIHKLHTTPFTTREGFDTLYNFDIEEEATTLAKQTKAENKLGFYSEDGYPAAFNIGAEYYLNTLFDDELKKSNKKTYQEMMFAAAELPYNKEQYSIKLTEKDLQYANEFLVKNNIDSKKLIGIHMGGGKDRWPSKAWSEEKIKEFIKLAIEIDYEILFFGGPNERLKHQKLIQDLDSQGITVYHNDPNNTDKQFASLVNACNKMVCSDSFAMHISLALKKPTISLFFCTSPSEVEDYGLLKKVISPLLYDFFPEKSDQYSEELVNSISAKEVLTALEQ